MLIQGIVGLYTNIPQQLFVSIFKSKCHVIFCRGRGQERWQRKCILYLKTLCSLAVGRDVSDK